MPAILALIMILSLSACGKSETSEIEYETEYVEYEWPVCECASLIPEPESKLGHIRVSTETRLVMDISDTSYDELSKYIEACAECGFNEVKLQMDDRYQAYNPAGWFLMLDLEDDDTAMLIDLRAPESEKEQENEAPSQSEQLDISSSEQEPIETPSLEEQKPTSEASTEQISEQTTEPSKSEEPISKSDSVYYSTNTSENAKNGNSGVFAYRHDDKNYDTYWIIDFDDGFAYTFTYGNDSGTCDKVEITSGDLNEYVVVTYHDGQDNWEEGLRFKRKRQPTTMVWMDGYGVEIEYTASDLQGALEIRDSLTIIEY